MEVWNWRNKFGYFQWGKWKLISLVNKESEGIFRKMNQSRVKLYRGKLRKTYFDGVESVKLIDKYIYLKRKSLGMTTTIYKL